MPKNLILVRHAKSDWSIQGQRDFDRTLNERGFRDAPKMGYRFAERKLKIDKLISSPAERAKLTAEFFAEQLKIDANEIEYNENIYDASVRILMNEVNQLNDQLNTVVIFGHNPGLSYFIEYVSGESLGEISTCAIVSLQFTVDSWKLVSKDTAKVVFHDYPSLYDASISD
ncbi:MAG: histidine phosphatase family protein [Bacteroidota bacterium]|nr:histidine phosphatase family protein [Bacteroidota bacterium]